MTPSPLVQVNVKMDRVMYDRLRKKAVRNERSVSAEVRVAIQKHLGGLT